MNLNYTDWKNEHKSVLENFPGKRIFMFYTGGKDSSAILSFLVTAGREFGFEFETNVAKYPKHVFVETEIKKLDNYWKARDVDIHWHNVNSSDELLQEAVEKGTNPCRVCQKIKRSNLFNFLKDIGERNKGIVIILSFNLWDLVSYSIEYLVSGVYSSNRSDNTSDDKSIEERFLQTSQRFYPLIELKDGLTIFKPLLKYNNQEIMRVIAKEKIPLSSIDCKYKNFTAKRILFEYYNQINVSCSYENVLNFTKQSFKLHELSYYKKQDKSAFIKGML